MNQLAINGGTPAIKHLPPRGHFGKEEKAAIDALFDNAIATGNAPLYHGAEETAFCNEFAAFLGGGYADMVNSGSNSVFVALRALNLPLFSEVVVGCITDAGGIMPVVMNNCIPIPADTAPGTFIPGPEQIEARITERTSAIVIAHIAGDPADMPAIMEVAKKHRLPVLEDCAQAHMARINGQNVGTFGDISAFSLMSGKHMCAGGQGAAVFTKSENLYWNVRRCADRGKPFGIKGGSGLPMQITLNCNADEIHAAIARAQLKKLPSFVEGRIRAVEWLKAHGLGECACFSLPQNALPAGFTSCYWRLLIRFNAENATCDKAQFVRALAAEGVPLIGDYSAGFPPCHDWYKKRFDQFPWNAPQYKGNPRAEYLCPNAQAALASMCMMLIQENFGEPELVDILEAFQKVDQAYRK